MRGSNEASDNASDNDRDKKDDVPAVGAASPVTPSILLRETPLDGLDARVLLCHALGWPRTALITRANAALQTAAISAFRTLEQRRLAGEPVAQLVGEREFFGRRFVLTPDVLIPRPDTELLVELALSAIDALATTTPGRPLRVLDLGTGSGAIAVTLAAERPTISVVATDRSIDALAVAERNAKAIVGEDTTTATARLRFFLGDWYDALRPEASISSSIAPRSHTMPAPFDLIVSNPPYIAADDPHLRQGDLRFEPRGALTDEADGLQAIHAILTGAPPWLMPGGPLLIEHGYDQGDAVRACFTAAGWVDVRTERDLGGNDRVTLGFRPS